MFKLQIQRREVKKHSEENCNFFTWRTPSCGEALSKDKGGQEIPSESSTFYNCGYKCQLIMIIMLIMIIIIMIIIIIIIRKFKYKCYSPAGTSVSKTKVS